MTKRAGPLDALRRELAAIESGYDKLHPMAAAGDLVVFASTDRWIFGVAVVNHRLDHLRRVTTPDGQVLMASDLENDLNDYFTSNPADAWYAALGSRRRCR